ncbi:MAG: DUF4401 domain-containing protein [Gemmatimonadaceae bacterium]
MRMTVGELMTRLRNEGIASEGDIGAVRSVLDASVEHEMPIYLRALVALGAWVATILLIVFFYAIHLLDDRTTALVFGVVLVGGAAWLRRRSNGDFTRHAAVAASFAGQGLIVTAVEAIDHGQGMPFIVAVLISLVMIVVFPDPLHRFVSAAIAVGATAAALVVLHVAHALDVTALTAAFACAWVWRDRPWRRSDDLTEMLTPVGYGLAIGLFALCLFSAFYSTVGHPYEHAPQFGAVTTNGVAVMLAALVLVILREHDTSPSSIAGVAILVIIALFAALTAKSPGIIIGAGILLLGFDRRNLVLIELASAFLIVFGAANYYNLDLTLLEKSGILVASGALCLVARLFVGKLLVAGKEALPE